MSLETVCGMVEKDNNHQILQNIETLIQWITNYHANGFVCNEDWKLLQVQLQQVRLEAADFTRWYSLVHNSAESQHITPWLLHMMNNILTNVLNLCCDTMRMCLCSRPAQETKPDGLLSSGERVDISHWDLVEQQKIETNSTFPVDSSIVETNEIDLSLTNPPKIPHDGAISVPSIEVMQPCSQCQYRLLTSCSYQAILYSPILNISCCKDEDILQVIETIYHQYDNSIESGLYSVTMEDIQSHFIYCIQQCGCEWDLIVLVMECMRCVESGNSVSLLIDALCSSVTHTECINLLGWRMIGSFMVIMEGMLSKRRQVMQSFHPLKESSQQNSITSNYLRYMLRLFFCCSSCLSHRYHSYSMEESGILVSITQIYKLQQYSEAIFALYLDLIFLYQTSNREHCLWREGQFQVIRDIANGDWIQDGNENKASIHDKILSETILFALRWLPLPFINKIAYSSTVPSTVSYSCQGIDWLLLALDRKYREQLSIFSTGDKDINCFAITIIGYLLSIHCLEYYTATECYEKVIGKYIWKWVGSSIYSYSLWNSTLCLLGIVGKTWQQMLCYEEKLHCIESHSKEVISETIWEKNRWILQERLISILQIETLDCSQKRFVALAIAYMWPSSTVCEQTRELSRNMQKSLYERLYQWYNKEVIEWPNTWIAKWIGQLLKTILFHKH
eukprot:jgi/Galph1/6033/GphlegSOOS_G4753.1